MNPDPTPEQPTVEQLLQRIRERVQSRARQNKKHTFSGTSSSPLQRSDFYPLQELREYAAAAYTHHNEVGKINPRNPGFSNELIQFFKKTIQRMLGWYTRPLHLFQASTAGALMEISRAFEDMQQKQLYIAEQIARLESELHSELTKLKSTAGNIHSASEGTANPSHIDSHRESRSNEGQS
jgi:hypothetical protein